jgi:RNA polymerase sigma factor (sigma-70 family)
MTSTRTQLPVGELVSRSRRGDGTAFAQLIRLHERLALGVAFGILHDAQAAGDAVQEALVKAWRRLGDLSADAHFPGWLCGIVRNVCLDQRRRKRVDTRDLAEASGRADERHGEPSEELGRRETGERVWAALESLDDLTRSAVVLRYYENLSSRDIAELLGLSPAAVDMRLMRGRQALKERLGHLTGV